VLLIWAKCETGVLAIVVSHSRLPESGLIRGRDSAGQRFSSSIAATDRSGLLWDEHHSAAGGFPPRPDVFDLTQWPPLGLQVQLAAGCHFE
jgi:hypothetical protein